MNGCRTGEFKWKQEQQIREGIVFANGCKERSCPCGTWTQCHRYNNWKYKHAHNDEHTAIISEWYNNHFRLRYECPETFPNG